MDYSRLLAWLARGRRLIAARLYTGLDESKPGVGAFLRRLQTFGYDIVRIGGKTYRDGSVKRPNADVYMVTDLLVRAATYDEATVVSGDGDFAYPVRTLLDLGKRVRVVSTREHLAQSLRESGADVVYLGEVWDRLLIPRRARSR